MIELPTDTEAPAGLVLAAGLGTRLKPLTERLAKPAVPFLGRPLIHYPLSLLYRGGLRRITVNLHHRPETVRQAVESWCPADVELNYSMEPAILGTGGAFRKAAQHLGGSDFFVVINGKVYFEQDLEPILVQHLQSGAWVTMVVVPHSGKEPFNPVLLDSLGRVEGFALRSQLKDFSNAYTYTGLQIVSRQVLGMIPSGFSDTVSDIYPALIADGRRISAFISDGFWSECSTPRRYLESALLVAARGGLNEAVSYDAQVNVVAGSNFRKAPDVRLSRVVAWDEVQIGSRSLIRNSIICHGCDLPADTCLENVVVSRSDQSRERPPGAQELGQCLVWPLE